MATINIAINKLILLKLIPVIFSVQKYPVKKSQSIKSNMFSQKPLQMFCLKPTFN